MRNVKALKPRQISAIQLLACGTPACRVAERLEVSTMTLYRWQQLPEFEAKLNSIVNSGLAEVAKKMNATALTAVESLQEILCDMTQPTPTRMKAALGVLAALPSVSSALEKNLKHRVADFDLQQRWEGTFTYDSSGNPIPEPLRVSSDVPVTV